MLYSLDKDEIRKRVKPGGGCGVTENCGMVQLWEVGVGKPFLFVVSRFAGAFI